MVGSLAEHEQISIFYLKKIAVVTNYDFCRTSAKMAK
jgi:hypothetical protein